jgi:hypothetical protein
LIDERDGDGESDFGQEAVKMGAMVVNMGGMAYT